MSKRTWLAAGAVGLLGATANLSAMTLATRGMGQVLEFPYYTVNGNQGTLLTIVNTASAVKAVKGRFREAYDGRVVAQFNVYLAPFDVWVAEVYSQGGTVAIGTQDNSCTVPKFDATVTPAGIPSLAFSTQNFTGTNTDGGPTDATRLDEGHFEFFEMGEVNDGPNHFLADALHNNGVPADCAALVNAWNAGGVWAANGAADVTAPTGGLYGSSAVVDVANGTYFEILPTVIDGFSTTVQHTAPSAAAPDFDTASAGGDGNVAVSIEAGGKAIQLHYPRPVDAVSALFMQATALNEYETTISIGAQTDWVATFPTKHYYVDPALNTSDDAAPFDGLYGADPDVAGACAPLRMEIFDREEEVVTPASCGFGLCPPTPVNISFCHEASVLQFATSGSALRTALKELPTPTGLLAAGYVRFDFATDHQLVASTEGTQLFGLPSVGFVAENLVNANATPGVLANYSFAIPHRSTILCLQNANPCF